MADDASADEQAPRQGSSDLPALGPELDAARARVVARGLVVEAFEQLTPVVLGQGLSLEALGPVKQLQKRFFSDVPWTGADDDALATAIGPGVGGGASELEPGLRLLWGWVGGRFRLRASSDQPAITPDDDATAHGVELDQLFDGTVVPEATPSPRTIRFATPPMHAGPGRAYRAGAAASDARVARLFAAFEDVTDVLVGPDFVAVTIARPNRWESLLAPVLRTVTDEFASPVPTNPPTVKPAARASQRGRSSRRTAEEDRSPRRLERAWAELGALRAERPEDLARVVAAARDSDVARRQVAAALLARAPRRVAAPVWEQLLSDPSRTVRRSVVDVVVDANNEALRPLLEQALRDADAWVRWKALRGVGTLGVRGSRGAVEACTDDPDFRVRLEAARTLTDAPTAERS